MATGLMNELAARGHAVTLVSWDREGAQTFYPLVAVGRLAKGRRRLGGESRLGPAAAPGTAGAGDRARNAAGCHDRVPVGHVHRAAPVHARAGSAHHCRRAQRAAALRLSGGRQAAAADFPAVAPGRSHHDPVRELCRALSGFLRPKLSVIPNPVEPAACQAQPDASSDRKTPALRRTVELSEKPGRAAAPPSRGWQCRNFRIGGST